MILLGANGYIGTYCKKYFNKKNIKYYPIGKETFNGSNPKTLLNIIRDTKSSFLINCAGYIGKPNVDACEYNKEKCLYSNAVLPGIIQNVCLEAKIPWIHVSTGCIYDGDSGKKNGFTEQDAPNFSFRSNNCSFYSGTKALGEEVINTENGIYALRLRIPFNDENHPRNYLYKLQNYKKLLNAVNSVTFIDDFLKCVDFFIHNKAPYGVYNTVNTDPVETKEITKLITKHLKIDGFDFFDSYEDFMSKAAITPRSNCVLDNSKLSSVGFQMMNSYEAIEQSLKNWSKNV